MSTEQKANFEQFFEAQSFFPKLKYIHGERLFDCDEIDGAITYRNLTVNACWATWQHLYSKIETAAKEIDEISDNYWKRWDIFADGYDQGNAAAYEHAARIIKDVL